MVLATMTSKGQLTVPREVRGALGLTTGMRVEFSQDGQGGWRIAASTESIHDLKGILARPGQTPATLEDMQQAIADGAARGVSLLHDKTGMSVLESR